MLRGLRKIGTVPGGFVRAPKAGVNPSGRREGRFDVSVAAAWVKEQGADQFPDFSTLGAGGLPHFACR